ncbi:MAG: VCBS repeat-containing protein [Chitinophagaceae bacterium]|nr:VCBS repeat-containing protein [Chitinophagaceae bacterium]
MFKYYFCLVSFLSLFTSCRNDSTALFTLLDKSSTGINFRNIFLDDGTLNLDNYIYFYNGGGVAIGDINNDNLQDILFTGNMVKNRLFLNKGNFEFEDITTQSGVAEKQGWCTGATMADINGDGKLDIYICRSADGSKSRRENLLFINNGDLTFSEQARKYGLADAGYSTQSAFFDYDKDGDLDCFIINHSLQKYASGAQEKPGMRNTHDPSYASKLYRNDDGHFTDVTEAAGITSNVLTFGLGITVSDFNNDGWPDVFESNDFSEPDYLFMNNGNGTFTEALAKCMDETSLFSMGADAADFNNDGHIDLQTLDMLAEDNRTQKMHSGAENFDKFQLLFTQGFYYQYSRNMLQKNNGDGTFSEVGQLAGVSNTDWSWSALFGDYDNDGYKDLLVTNGYLKDHTDMDFIRYSIDRLSRAMNKQTFDPIPVYIKKMPSLELSNYIFQNNGDETFVKRTDEWGLNKVGVSAGAAYSDLDNDGDLDLVINNSNDYADIYRNNAETRVKNNFLRVRLKGNPLNERGIGARVKLFCKGGQYYQEQSPVRGFQSSTDPVLNFGVGKNELIDSLLVIWPDDRFEKLNNVKPNQTLTLNLADAKEKWFYDTTVRAKQTLLSQEVLPEVRHHENQFSDFNVQSLLPNYLSREGPCIEVADINGDGREDFFIGSGKGRLSQVFTQDANGTFTAKAQPDISKDSASEDVAAAFFDADNDGDKDLYVACGGYEFEENDVAFQDRFYMNDGKGNFRKKIDALPPLLTSKHCVKHADIDGDGDIDLFVGGRVVPGKYPTTPRSYILINDGKGTFKDSTEKVCADLQTVGIVTDAVFTDLNNDKQPDLLVVGEWMPVKVFINQHGKLTDASSQYIGFGSAGWWNRIAAEDMDGDGDEDFIIGNCGLNTQFHVNEKEPMSVYFKDFDGNGSVEPVLCYYINGVSYPVNSRDDLTEQLPGLKKKFIEYKAYAVATIDDVFRPEQLKDAVVLKAEMMQTVYLENQGVNKPFKLHRLPLPAQYSPVYGIATADINNDGGKDILLAGNNSWTRIKFGRYNANHGVVLLGDGKGNFTYATQTESGLSIRGNVRSLQKIKTAKSQSIIAGVNDNNALLLQIK